MTSFGVSVRMRRRTDPPAPFTAARATASEIPCLNLTINSFTSLIQRLDLLQLVHERIRCTIFFRTARGELERALRRAKPGLDPPRKPSCSGTRLRFFTGELHLHALTR